MRRIPLLLATLWTLTYMIAVQAAIASDLSATTRRAVAEVARRNPGAIWNGGTLAPIIVEADAPHGDRPASGSGRPELPPLRAT
jgi:hypothetical protein